eukprot:TRINITY_DN1502_c0_g1_i2.p1 TRINITY_DN1502_c0_g1~~TRINITY_DN1502_c0_g1_i2.p1  ORF type:complete len:454 (+),score=113.90 TRINITY_DN1502_c0_g1_i2:36-1397(+)
MEEEPEEIEDNFEYIRNKIDQFPTQEYLNYLEQAKSGDPIAQIVVCRKLYSAVGVNMDRNEAKDWCRKSLEAGNLVALGYSYFCGWFDCEKSDEEALLYFEKHLREHQHEHRADNCVARMMIAFSNQNLGNDFLKVRELYERTLGDFVECGANNNLGALYHHGKGVKQNGNQAKKLYLKSFERGQIYSLTNIGILYRDGVPPLKQDYSKAYQYFQIASKIGDPIATWSIGLLHKNGTGLEKSIDLAMKYFEKAAKTGNNFANNGLGAIYFNGDCHKVDYEKSFYHFKFAAERGDEFANYNLGLSYENGRGTEKNDKLAYFYYEKAAELGHKNSQTLVARAYKDGTRFPQNMFKAALFYMRNGSEKSILDLQSVIKTKLVPWKTYFLKYWPITPEKKFKEYLGDILLLLLISKFGKKENKKLVFFSKLVCMITIKHYSGLCLTPTDVNVFVFSN